MDISHHHWQTDIPPVLYASCLMPAFAFVFSEACLMFFLPRRNEPLCKIKCQRRTNERKLWLLLHPVNQPSCDSNPSLSFWLRRGTAFGILNGVCKLAAIIASFIFAAFIGITKIIPIFLAFAALVCGGMVALKLPETREKILSWKAKILQPPGPKRSLAMGGGAAYYGMEGMGGGISFLKWNRKMRKARLC